MDIKRSQLFQGISRRAGRVPDPPSDLLQRLDIFFRKIRGEMKYVVRVFPEYTPHDSQNHLDHLFRLADRVLGRKLYARLCPSELLLLAFGLYAHDWGMAISESEEKAIKGEPAVGEPALLPGEPASAQEFLQQAIREGSSPEAAWREYVRRTHGPRSGLRARASLAPLGPVFADAVAKVCEGHALEMREVRDVARYPLALSVFGETANLAAVTDYVRIVDLLDIGEDRTPFALWKFVGPADPVSKIEWGKHRSLSPVAVDPGAKVRVARVSGQTDDPVVFAALADLRSWVDEQFVQAVSHVRTLQDKYHLDIDSRIDWDVSTSGFEPLLVRFELDRSEILKLLSNQLYGDDPLAFVRELLQNSVDAIDARQALQGEQGLSLKGEIQVRARSTQDGLSLEWADNGVGMDANVLRSFFATVGSTWYNSREARNLPGLEPVSQFGVGILSCFAVSPTLELKTRTDKSEGLAARIPSRDAHFRIRAARNVHVGTTVRLEIPARLAGLVSSESIADALRRISRFVRHRITFDSDGIVSELRPGGPFRLAEEDRIEIRGMRGDAAEQLLANARTVTIEIGSSSGDYHGLYSAVVPRVPGAASRDGTDLSGWALAGARVDFDDVLIRSEEAIFAKGIQSGRVSRPRRSPSRGRHLARPSSWPSPKILVNVGRPSLVRFNLARSEATLTSPELMGRAWKEIAAALRADAFGWPLSRAHDAALLIGSCATFCGVPDRGLDALLRAGEVPVLVLRPGEGLVWATAEEFSSREELLEAPFELGFAARDPEALGRACGLGGWEGDDALMPLDGVDPRRIPWLGPALAFGQRALGQLGWRPYGLCFVRQPSGEALPLVCRTWGRLRRGYEPPAPEGEARSAEGLDVGTLKLAYDQAPELLHFPPSASAFAAVGSRYWNISHPKVRAIAPAIAEVTKRLRRGGLSPGGRERVSYLASHRFYGFPVASRMSTPTLALRVPNLLLDAAESEGIRCTERLAPGDFLPGTVGQYENPYHYDLEGWDRPGSGIGRRLDV